MDKKHIVVINEDSYSETNVSERQDIIDNCL